MSTWDLILYAVASFLALRSLLSLMVAHKRDHLLYLTAEERQRRRRERRQAEAANGAA